MRRIRHIPGAVFVTVTMIGLSGCVVAAPLIQPMLQRALVDVATAQFVGENCGSLSFDTAKAKTQLQSVYSRLTNTGTPPDVVEAQAEAFEDQALDDAVAARLETAGVDPVDPDPENVCAFGEAEKTEGSLLGGLLS